MVKDSQEVIDSVRRLRIVILNHYAGSPDHGMEYRPYYFARQWQEAGHSVTIVAGSESHLRSQPVHMQDGIAEQFIGGVRYVWLRTPTYHGNGVKRVLNIATFVAQATRYARAILNGCRADVVIASSTYPLDILAALRLQRISGASLIFEVHDLWPLSPIELGGMKRSHPFIVVMQWAENLAYRSASAVVSLLPNTVEHMTAHGMKREHFHYIPNGVDCQAWERSLAPLPEEHANTFFRLRQQGTFIIGYAGSHGIANSLDTVLEAAKLLRHSPIAFVLVGQGPERARLRAESAARDLSNVVFLPAVEREAVPELLRHFDAGYLGWRRQPLYRFGISPNKLMDYMMARLPVIHGVDASNDPVRDAQAGISIPPEEPHLLAEAATAMSLLGTADRLAMGARGREYIVAHHSYQVLAGRFLNIMQDLASQKQLMCK